ncbi:MAG: DNA repair protein RadC [Gaiellales bacterium]
MSLAAEAERPLERLATLGPRALTARELLALVLHDGRSGEQALDLAADLLADQGDLVTLARAHPDELARLPGMGAESAAAVVAAFQIGRLVGLEEAPLALKCSDDVATVAMAYLADARCERVIVLVCDAGNRLCRVVTVSEGSVDRSLVPVREILHAVLIHNGRAFALAHNHPSGDPTPSRADERATRDLRIAAGLVGLRFLDHVVVADRRWKSCVSARR